MYSDNMKVSVFPQRQENTGFAAVVARGGGQGWPGKRLSQGPAGSGASTTAGKYGFRCRCGKGGEDRRAEMPQGAGNRSGRKVRKSGAIWNDGTSSVIPP